MITSKDLDALQSRIAKTVYEADEKEAFAGLIVQGLAMSASMDEEDVQRLALLVRTQFEEFLKTRGMMSLSVR